MPDISEQLEIHQLSQADEICRILTLLQSEHCLLNVQFENDDRLYTSIILNVDMNECYFVLDELNPYNGHRRMTAHEKFSIRTQLNGINVFWKNNVISDPDDELETDDLYIVKFPAELHYQQRRDAYRVKLHNTLSISARYQYKELDKKIAGNIVDISVTGCKVEFPSSISDIIPYITEFSDVNIPLPNSQAVSCLSDIRHWFYNEEKNRVYCGLQFQGLNNYEQRQISRYINIIQREDQRFSN